MTISPQGTREECRAVVMTHEIFSRRQGGALRYSIELVRALIDAGAEAEIIAPLHLARIDGVPVTGLRVPVTVSYRTGLRALSSASRSIENALLHRAAARAEVRGRALVVHQSYYGSRPPSVQAPVVVTVHDMTHETFPSLFDPRDPTSEWKRRSTRRADAILVDSFATRSKLFELHDLDEDRVVVAHLGVRSVDPDDEQLVTLRSAPPFLLFVGPRSGYKNFDTFCKAFGNSTAAREGVGLVLFGGGPLKSRERELLESCGIASRTVCASGPDSILWSYYVAARGLVCPSLDEGFGLPPLEAMAAGCPVAVADAGSLPEVAGDAAIVFDPCDIDAMAAAIDQVCLEGDVRDELERRGPIRAAGFTWEKTASAALNAYSIASAHFSKSPKTR